MTNGVGPYDDATPYRRSSSGRPPGERKPFLSAAVDKVAQSVSDAIQDEIEGRCRSCGHGLATAHDSDGECWKPGCDCLSEVPDAT